MKDLIEEFFKDVTPVFSDLWKHKLQESILKKLKGNELSKGELVSLIRKIHTENYTKLFANLKLNKMISTDRTLTYDDKEEIIQLARIKFNSSYNPSRAIEESFLSGIILRNIIVDFKRKKASLVPIHEEINTVSENDDGSIVNMLNMKNAPIDINYISFSGKKYGGKSIALIKHLLIVQPEIFEKHKSIHSFPDIKFEYPSKDFIEKQYKFLKNIDDFIIDVPGYFRHYTNIHANERYFMNKAIDVLKECKNNFETSILPQIIKDTGMNEIKIRNNTPLLSAIAVDTAGVIINTAYKGETGCMDKHCEYTLFEEILTQSDKQSLVGGSLYVTLEPCNKRTFYFDENNNKKAKVPCAVRCVESGIRKIFIGTFDPNIRVNWKGIEILKTGTYKFVLDNGEIVGENDIEIEVATLLIKEFDIKGYKKIKNNKVELVYQIGNPVEVNFFHPDLSIEIMKLNSDFISKHTDKAFPYSQTIR